MRRLPEYRNVPSDIQPPSKDSLIEFPADFYRDPCGGTWPRDFDRYLEDTWCIYWFRPWWRARNSMKGIFDERCDTIVDWIIERLCASFFHRPNWFEENIFIIYIYLKKWIWDLILLLSFDYVLMFHSLIYGIWLMWNCWKVHLNNWKFKISLGYSCFASLNKIVIIKLRCLMLLKNVQIIKIDFVR